ncbi:MAG: hypothetical protein K2Z80_01905, partial [Xanthobacteraceae bacterium]|nr:hypothetical protein [Xanthobacteraceae bacterium]
APHSAPCPDAAIDGDRHKNKTGTSIRPAEQESTRRKRTARQKVIAIEPADCAADAGIAPGYFDKH